MRIESQSIENTKQHDEKQQSKTHIDDFVQLSQFLKKSLDSKTIVTIAKITRDRANAFYRDEKNLKRKWMINEMFDRKLVLYKLSKLRQENNKCSYCKISQYEKICRDKSNKKK